MNIFNSARPESVRERNSAPARLGFRKYATRVNVNLFRLQRTFKGPLPSLPPPQPTEFFFFFLENRLNFKFFFFYTSYNRLSSTTTPTPPPLPYKFDRPTRLCSHARPRPRRLCVFGDNLPTEFRGEKKKKTKIPRSPMMTTNSGVTQRERVVKGGERKKNCAIEKKKKKNYRTAFIALEYDLIF